MQKVIVRRPGSYNRLEVTAEPEPPVPEGHALVRTASIGVNFADVVVRLGLYPSAKKYVGWPITPGFEFSGVIERLGTGDNPDDLKVGDRVVGVVRFGAYAGQIAAPYQYLFRVPGGVGLVEAGVIPVASLTAYYALQTLGAAASGKKVLIHSAAGGVGSAMVQMAKIFGCEVTGVVGSPEKVEFVRALGADFVFVKKSKRFVSRLKEVAPEGFDLILDANGAHSMRQSYHMLRPTGRLILYGAHTMLTRGSGRPNWFKLAWDFLRTPRFNPLDMINENKSVMAFNLSYLFDERELLRTAFTQILGWYGEGRLRLPRVEEFPLGDVGAAHKALQSGATMGKLTLIPEGAPRDGRLPEQNPARLVGGKHD